MVRGAPRYRVPPSAAAAGAVLIALGLLAAALPSDSGGPVVCPFRAATGLPCPTCGLVRSVRHVLHGDVASAFALNPLDAIAILVGAPAALAMLVANRTRGWAIRFFLSPLERRSIWSLVAVLLLANWLYVLATQR